ncbi:hypothetical protein NliqN6_1032 [Naganishia liquefaciens]|uniref:HMG box domain-containing protein n=1 Tax=Naganishia liquefaciens TaxID=104408 RepID=A0A8H3TQB1_9TREE|nr:hypothetical protein NliqN6_1032 [Naganishia liquefaciens]
MPKAKKEKELQEEHSDEAEEPKKRKKAKSKKDPNAPKRAMSAFMFYSMAQRDNVKNANPDLSFGEIGKQLGEQWRNLTPEEKRASHLGDCDMPESDLGFSPIALREASRR